MRKFTSVSIFALFIMVAFSFVASDTFAQADSLKAKESYNAGLEAEKAGKTDEALISYRAAIAADPNFVDPYINLGTLLFGQKKYDEALKTFRDAVDKDPQNADAWANIGRVEYVLNRYQQSAEAFQKAIAIEPKNGELYKEIGKTYYRQREWANTIDALQKCHANGAGDYVSYYMLGKAYDKSDQESKAIEAYQQSIQQENNYAAQFALGSIYMAQEKYNQAASAFKSALAVDKDRFRASYNYASAREFANPDNYDENIKNWEAFVRLAKGNPKAKTMVSQAEEHIGQLKEAKKVSEL